MKISILKIGMIHMIIMGMIRLKRLFLNSNFLGYPKALNISIYNTKQKSQQEGAAWLSRLFFWLVSQNSSSHKHRHINWQQQSTSLVLQVFRVNHNWVVNARRIFLAKSI